MIHPHSESSSADWRRIPHQVVRRPWQDLNPGLGPDAAREETPAQPSVPLDTEVSDVSEMSASFPKPQFVWKSRGENFNNLASNANHSFYAKHASLLKENAQCKSIFMVRLDFSWMDPGSLLSLALWDEEVDRLGRPAPSLPQPTRVPSPSPAPRPLGSDLRSTLPSGWPLHSCKPHGNVLSLSMGRVQSSH